jgi:hypothetical protein
MADLKTGFLEEAPGVKSATRLVATLCGASIALIGVAVAFALIYAVMQPDGRDGLTGIFGTVAGIIAALGGGAWGALRERTGGP